MCLSHVGITVEEASFDKIVDWYLTVLGPVGYKMMYDLRPHVQTVGLGAKYPDFWIYAGQGHTHPSPDQKLHVAFITPNRQVVRDFHAVALKIGSKDNGAPGLRTDYTPTYYGAYVLDPEGRNVEVHAMYPEFWAEPKQKNTILASLGAIAAAVGLSYFANIGGYLGSWAL